MVSLKGLLEGGFAMTCARQMLEVGFLHAIVGMYLICKHLKPMIYFHFGKAGGGGGGGRSMSPYEIKQPCVPVFFSTHPLG